MLSDFSDENNAYMIYFVSFLGTLAVLPGNIVSALLMDKIGRLRMLGKKSVIRHVIKRASVMVWGHLETKLGFPGHSSVWHGLPLIHFPHVCV